MPLNKLKEFLDSHHIRYTAINHAPAYTAQEVAQSAHIPGQEMIKSVILKIDGNMKMIVLPATEKVDFELIRNLTHAHKVELASEYEFNSRFPDCELGAMPPFGNLFGMDVLMADSLNKLDEMAFNAGTHTEILKSHIKDFVKYVKPQMVEGL